MLIRFLLIALLLLLVARAFWRFVAGVIDGVAVDPRRSGPPDRGVQMVRDPICGTFLVPSRALTFTDRGVVRYFCSEACRRAFQRGGRSPA